MNKSSQNPIYFGLLLLLVFLGYTYFGSKKEIPVKNVSSDEQLQVPPSAPLHATLQAQIPSSTTIESSDTSNAPMVPEDSLYSPEKIAQRKKNPLGLCGYLDGKSERSKTFERMINSHGSKEGSIEKTILLVHQMSVTKFQLDLPVGTKFYAELESGKVPTKEERALFVNQSNIELQNNYRRAEVIFLRSYYTLLLARAAALNPQLLHDTEMAAMCSKLQKIGEPLSRQELNNLMYSYLERVQLQASDVKFSPTFEPYIEVRMGPDGPFYFTSDGKDL